MRNPVTYIFLLFSIILLYWVTYIEKIGLHGDEAFFGIDSVEILINGLTRPYGMNKYSGILQSLISSISFNIFDINVISLRIGGIICNVIALSISLFIIRKRMNNYVLLFFLLLIAQSILILGYSKIAWEVCSLNFLFIMITLASTNELVRNKKSPKYCMQFVFLFATLLGTYNHIIFSSFIVSLFMGIIFLLLFKDTKPQNELIDIFSLISLSLFNIVLLYAFMNYAIDYLWKTYNIFIFLLPFIFISIEILFFKKVHSFFKILSFWLSKKTLSKSMRIIIPLSLIVPYIIIHFLNVFDILANRVLLIRLFSYELNPLLEFYFIFVALSLSIYVFYKLIFDIIKNRNNLWSYIIISYFGVLCLYTQGASIRYYLILTILQFIYLSIKLSYENKAVRTFFISILIISTISIQSILWSINLNPDRKIKATTFKIGKKNTETSAHFLSFSPVIDYVHKNKIGKIETKDAFFIGQVFKFYSISMPEIKDYKHTAEINYDYSTKNTGFKID